MKRIRGQASSRPQLSEEQADALFQNIMNDLQMESDMPRQTRRPVWRTALRRYFVRRAAIAACAVVAAASLAPGTVVPASVSEVSAAPSSDASSVQVRFHVDTLIPVREVTAQINEQSLSVEEDGYQNYLINVEENGYLLLDIYSMTGMHTTHGMEITGIDTDAPVITGHQLQDGQIVIYLSDGDGVGVDYDSISACCKSDGAPVYPTACSEAGAYVSFALPDQEILITIPDKNGNYRVVSLAASE